MWQCILPRPVCGMLSGRSGPREDILLSGSAAFSCCIENASEVKNDRPDETRHNNPLSYPLRRSCERGDGRDFDRRLDRQRGHQRMELREPRRTVCRRRGEDGRRGVDCVAEMAKGERPERDGDGRMFDQRPDRFPQITFLYDDGQPAKPIRFSAVSRADTAEVQTYDANPSRSARGIKISSGTGTCGDWGIFEMDLHAKGELAVDSPKSPGLILIIR